MRDAMRLTPPARIRKLAPALLLSAGWAATAAGAPTPATGPADPPPRADVPARALPTPTNAAGPPAAARRGNPAAADATPPTAEQIVEQFDAGNYAEVQRMLARVLALKGKAAEPYNRFELFKLKAETLLRLKALAGAAAAFAEAAGETDDARQKAAALATAAMLKKANPRDQKYARRFLKKNDKADPVDVVDPVTRKAALDAFLADELAAAAPKVEAAKKSRTLPPVVDGLNAARAVMPIELGVTGTDERSKATVAELGDQAKVLIAKELDRIGRYVDETDRYANDTVTIKRQFRSPNGAMAEEDVVHKRGLRVGDMQQLKAAEDACAAIAPAARSLAEALGEQNKGADALADKAEELRKRAARVRQDQYGEI